MIFSSRAKYVVTGCLIVFLSLSFFVQTTKAQPVLTCGQAAANKFGGPDRVKNAACQDACLNPGVEIPEATTDCLAPKKCCAASQPPPAPAGAATKGSTGSSIVLDNPLGNVTIYDIIQRIIRAFLGIVGALALAVFFYAGILWMTAMDSKRVQTAQAAMKYAVLGIALIAFAYAITTFFIGAVTGSLVGR